MSGSGGDELELHRQVDTEGTGRRSLEKTAQRRGCLEDRVAIIGKVGPPQRERIAVVA